MQFSPRWAENYYVGMVLTHPLALTNISELPVAVKSFFRSKTGSMSVCIYGKTRKVDKIHSYNDTLNIAKPISLEVYLKIDKRAHLCFGRKIGFSQVQNP